MNNPAHLVWKFAYRSKDIIKRYLLLPSPSWTTEVYGLGKSIRELTKYPQRLKIFAVMTHGVGFEPRLYPHEANNPARLYLGWHPLVVDCNVDVASKKIIRIPHPWPGYRERCGYKPRDDAAGTIVFFPHTTPDIQLEWDADEYLASLQVLDEIFKPITVCLHHHDLKQSIKDKIESYGMKWTTVGDPFDPNFVDKFYDIISRVKLSTSPSWGSHVAYCVNFGIPFFYFGSAPRTINISDPNMAAGEITCQSSEAVALKAEADRLFGKVGLVVTGEQRDFVNRLLGQDATAGYRRLLIVLSLEYLRAWYRSLIQVFSLKRFL